MNAFQFDALVFDLAVVQDHVPADVKSHIRAMSREDDTLLEFIKPGKRQLPNGQIVNVDFESQVESLRDQYAKAKPIERRNMALKAREAQLRGDLYEVMLFLDVDEPGDVRDLVRYSGALLQNPQPGAIQEALELYRDHSKGNAVGEELAARFKLEFESLYPPDEE